MSVTLVAVALWARAMVRDWRHDLVLTLVRRYLRQLQMLEVLKLTLVEQLLDVVQWVCVHDARLYS